MRQRNIWRNISGNFPKEIEDIKPQIKKSYEYQAK